MTEILATLGAMLLGFLAVVLATVFVSVLRAGPSEVAYLRRKDYGFRPWFAGALPKTSRGATMRELEGVELKAEKGRLSHARPTRALSAELPTL
jgi:hypothetical protein